MYTRHEFDRFIWTSIAHSSCSKYRGVSKMMLESSIHPTRNPGAVESGVVIKRQQMSLSARETMKGQISARVKWTTMRIVVTSLWMLERQTNLLSNSETERDGSSTFYDNVSWDTPPMPQEAPRRFRTNWRLWRLQHSDGIGKVLIGKRKSLWSRLIYLKISCRWSRSDYQNARLKVKIRDELGRTYSKTYV